MAKQKQTPIERAAAKVEARRLPIMRGIPFVSIDPGTGYHAWALWTPAGGLQDCGYEPDLWPRFPELPCVIEQPIVYPHSTRNPPTIARLAWDGGIVAGRHKAVHAVEPRQWKGTTEGSTFLRRIERAIAAQGQVTRYRVQECLAVVPKKLHEHVIDACGLGLVILGVKV